MSADVMRYENVKCGFRGDKAKHVLALANEGIGYVVLKAGKLEGQAFCVAAFKRPLDRPRADHHEQLTDYERRKVEEKWALRRGERPDNRGSSMFPVKPTLGAPATEPERPTESPYHRRKHRSKASDDVEIAIDEDTCSILSIYLLKADGSLWTVRHTQEGAFPYKQVRQASKELPRAVFVCVVCKKQWIEAPTTHS